MSYIAETFDPSSAISGTFNTNLPLNGKFIAINESIVGLTFTFSDGSQQVCPADTAAVFTLPTATPIVTWSQKNVLTSAAGPISEVTVMAYQPNEAIIGTYPVSLGRITSVGNPIPLSTSATSIVNTGNAAGTPIVTGQVLGDGGNASNLTNDGQLTLGDGLHQGSLTVPSTATINGTGLHVLAGVSKFDNGLAGTDGAGNFGAGTVSTNAVNATAVNAGTVNVTTINTDTINLNVVLTLLKGTLKRIGKSTGSADQVITHNWGHQADIVIPYYNGAFGTPPTQALAVKNETANSFEVVGQAGYSWTVLFIGF